MTVLDNKQQRKPDTVDPLTLLIHSTISNNASLTLLIHILSFFQIERKQKGAALYSASILLSVKSNQSFS
jgi:hypothetical protein